MTKRSGRAAAGVAVALLVAGPAAAQNRQPAPASTARVITDTGKLAGPRQPIFFRHDVHAGQDQIPCLYCHSTVTVSSEPGIPAVQTCFGCHQMIAGSTPSHQAEIKKVREAWVNKQVPRWVRVHALPGFVHFPHMRHVNAGVTCQTCHGQIQTMKQVYQASSLNMGWCVNCHIGQSNPPLRARYDCSACHY